MVQVACVHERWSCCPKLSLHWPPSMVALQSASLPHVSSGDWHAMASEPQPGNASYVVQARPWQSSSLVQGDGTHAPTGSPHKQTSPTPHSLSATHPY